MQWDKRSLIFECVPAIRIDVLPIGENLTQITYVGPQACHVWQLFTKLSRGRNRSTTPGMKSWFSLGSSGPAVVLGYLILPPFCQPWSSGYSSSKCLLSYVGLLGPIYQHAVNTVQYLLDRAKAMRSLIDIDGGYHLGVSHIHIPLSDLHIRWYYAFS
jgi:hypothetical protein